MDLKSKVLSALKVAFKGRAFGESFLDSHQGFYINEIKSSACIQFNVIAELYSISMNGTSAYNYWLINCNDDKIVTVDTLKSFLLSMADISEKNIRKTFITSRYPFNRSALRYAFENNIGLARIAPLGSNPKIDIGTNLIQGISPLELKEALCTNEFGTRRKEFYGFNSSGKIEQLGSLENYFRSEMFSINL
ncbi:hypothetical protein [Phosphitispora sp. TUW77]|uniref:hypothetical protein n=1 Tax=Phosphitispora sp. TUW77 TaxID=3152361 RepID=UPI003AB4F032